MTTHGPPIKTNLVQVYVFARTPDDLLFLQLRRATTPMRGAWQPVLGKVESSERATDAALRELREETGLTPSLAPGVWALEAVDTFYMPADDAIYMVPQLAAEAPADWSPALNHEHDDWRWVPCTDVETSFMWPGQHRAIDEIVRFLAQPSLAREHLRLDV